MTCDVGIFRLLNKWPQWGSVFKTSIRSAFYLPLFLFFLSMWRFEFVCRRSVSLCDPTSPLVIRWAFIVTLFCEIFEMLLIFHVQETFLCLQVCVGLRRKSLILLAIVEDKLQALCEVTIPGVPVALVSRKSPVWFLGFQCLNVSVLILNLIWYFVRKGSCRKYTRGNSQNTDNILAYKISYIEFRSADRTVLRSRWP